MTNRTTPAAAETAITTTAAPSALEKINQALAVIPSVQDDPTESMLELVLASETPADWASVFASESLRDYAGRQVSIRAMRVLKSDFEGGLSHYLVLDAVDLKSGEKVVLTCSSQMSIAQLLNAQARGFWPINVEIVQKDKPTKAGFRPIHLKYIGGSPAPLGDPTKIVSEQ